MDASAGRATLQRGLFIGFDQAAVDREAFAADKTFFDAPREHGLEQPTQEIAVAEAAMTVLREGRVIRHTALEAEPAEPAIGEVQMHLVAKPAFRADPKAVADDQHTDHQLGIDRRAPELTVEWREPATQIAQVDEAIDQPQKVILRHMGVEGEVVEQSALLDLPRPIIDSVSSYETK